MHTLMLPCMTCGVLTQPQQRRWIQLWWVALLAEVVLSEGGVRATDRAGSLLRRVRTGSQASYDFVHNPDMYSIGSSDTSGQIMGAAQQGTLMHGASYAVIAPAADTSRLLLEVDAQQHHVPQIDGDKLAGYLGQEDLQMPGKRTWTSSRGNLHSLKPPGLAADAADLRRDLALWGAGLLDSGSNYVRSASLVSSSANTLEVQPLAVTTTAAALPPAAVATTAALPPTIAAAATTAVMPTVAANAPGVAAAAAAVTTALASTTGAAPTSLVTTIAAVVSTTVSPTAPMSTTLAAPLTASAAPPALGATVANASVAGNTSVAANQSQGQGNSEGRIDGKAAGKRNCTKKAGGGGDSNASGNAEANASSENCSEGTPEAQKAAGTDSGHIENGEPKKDGEDKKNGSGSSEATKADESEGWIAWFVTRPWTWPILGALASGCTYMCSYASMIRSALGR